MREILAPIELCDGDGRLRPEAVGWSRRPLHRCNLRGLGKKRWDWWCVTDGRWFLLLCVADVDLLAGGVVSLMDLENGRRAERIMPWRTSLGDSPGEVHFRGPGMTIDVEPTRVAVSCGPIEGEFALGPAPESVNVVVPWSESKFWFTSKLVGVPAKGRLRFRGESREMDGWAACDFGRGRAPSRIRWNWGVAVGDRIAFNLGGRWTDSTPATENGLLLDGRLTKLSAPIRWEPGWRLRSDEVELDFAPSFERRVGLPPHVGLRWCTGHYRGRILDQPVERLWGWAEALDIP